METQEANQGQLLRGGQEAAARLIPQPAKASWFLSPHLTRRDCLARQMRLSKTTEHLALYCTLVARVSTLSDDHESSLKNIVPHDPHWCAFVDLVKRELPIIEAYENAWPVLTIVREHRHRKRYRGKHLGLVRWGDKAPRAPNAKPTALDLSQHPNPPRSGAPRPQAPTTSVSMPSRTRITPLRPAQQHDTERVRYNEQRVSPGLPVRRHGSTPPPSVRRRSRQFMPYVDIPARQKRANPPAPVPAGRESASVGPASVAGSLAPEPLLAFLRALEPPQDVLLPVLVEKGVTGEAELDALARMPRVRRKQLLNGWLREEAITELQFVVLEAGFEGRA